MKNRPVKNKIAAKRRPLLAFKAGMPVVSPKHRWVNPLFLLAHFSPAQGLPPIELN